MMKLCPICEIRKPKRDCFIHEELCDACCGMNRNEKCGSCSYYNPTNLSEKILQLKIVLQGTNPPVWRRVLIENFISFYQFHNIIQTVMGWENDHMFEFDQGNLSIGIPHEDFRGEVQDAKKIKINEVLSEEGQKLPYIYDYGDSWKHVIVIEKILNKDDNSQKYPACIKGKRACPPEDCGGVWGYEEMVEALKDKNHPKYEHWFEWVGEFDPEKFDLEEVNKKLQMI